MLTQGELDLTVDQPINIKHRKLRVVNQEIEHFERAREIHAAINRIEDLVQYLEWKQIPETATSIRPLKDLVRRLQVIAPV